MRVVHLLPTLDVGGAEQIVLELARRLSERGYDVHVIAMMGGGRLLAEFEHADIPTTVFPKTGPYGSFGFFPTRRRVRELRPVIVHTHLFGADLWGRLAAFTARVPVVVTTEHNMFPHEGWLTRATKKLLASQTDAIIAVSGAVKRHLLDVDRLPKNTIRLIQNGIDLARVIPRTARAFRDVPRLLTVGRLDPQKGHATLLKSLARVKRPWMLDIVGVGPLERDLKALAERLAIAPRIRWLGVRKDVSSLLSASDIFCFPSLWEGFGLAAVEAAAAGVPIVASDLEVCREILAGDATFAPPGDVPAFAHAIDAILGDPIPRIALAQRGVSRIRKSYSLERMVDGYVKVYRELVARPSTSLGILSLPKDRASL
ncbi:MAG: glycosyltransferase [Patescibacteria group bacterium]